VALVLALGMIPGTLAMAYEQPAYEVVSADGDFELRRYAPLLLAETVVEGEFTEVGGKAFRRLADYISGNNERRVKIAMTAPVSQRRESETVADERTTFQSAAGSGRYVFGFVVPSDFSVASVPAPTDPAVRIRQVPGRLMAVLRYSGGWSEERYRAEERRLMDMLEEKSLRPLGQPVFARYNSPFALWFLRRNEVMMQVEEPTGMPADTNRRTRSDDDTLARFSSRDEPPWRSINDGVMGGLSSGSLRVTPEGTAIFSGEVSLDNKGGFASVRSAIGRRDLSAFDGVQIRMRGDGRRYRIRLHTHGGMDGVAYQAAFDSVDREWRTVRLPFAEFEASFRGRRPAGAPPLDPATIEQLGLMIADGHAGPFRLEIDWIKTYLGPPRGRDTDD
jgi:hypothetical protein